MGWDKQSTSSTSPDIPDFVWDFLETVMDRYSLWSGQGFEQFMGGEGGATFVPQDGASAGPGRTIKSALNPNFYDVNTGKFTGDPSQVPRMDDLVKNQGFSPEEAREIIENWGKDVNPEDYFVVVDDDGNTVGSYTDMKEQIGDFWKEHERPVVGPDELELEAAQRALGIDRLPEEYDVGKYLLGQMMGLDPNEELARGLLLDVYNKTTEGSELSEWAQALRAAGEKKIDIGDLLSTDTYRQLEDVFKEGQGRMIDSASAMSGLGRSPAAGAARGAAFGPYLQNLINSALTTEAGNRAAEMQGISGGAGILADDLNRALNAASLASGGLLDLGGRAKGRIGEAASGYFGVGGAQQAARQQAISNLAALGGTFRDVSQQAAQSPWEDWMRRAAAFESSLVGPMGMVPSMFGATTTSQKKNK